jgi:putative tricarboxylic transport membrane protein
MRFSDSAIGTFLILFGGAVLLYTRKFPSMEGGQPGPASYPNLLAALIVLVGLGLAVQGTRRGERFFRLDTSQLSGSGILTIFLVLAAIVLYIFVSDALGFLITSFALLVFLMRWLRVSFLWTILMAAATTLAIFLLFGKILRVPLPWGLWGW